MVAAAVGRTPVVACGMVSLLLSHGASAPVVTRTATWSEASLPKANPSDGSEFDRSYLGGEGHLAQTADCGSVVWHLWMPKKRRAIGQKRGVLPQNMTIPLWRVIEVGKLSHAAQRFQRRVWNYPGFPNPAPSLIIVRFCFAIHPRIALHSYLRLNSTQRGK